MTGKLFCGFLGHLFVSQNRFLFRTQIILGNLPKMKDESKEFWLGNSEDNMGAGFGSRAGKLFRRLRT